MIAPAAPAGRAPEAGGPQELYLRYLRVRQAMATPASAQQGEMATREKLGDLAGRNDRL